MIVTHQISMDLVTGGHIPQINMVQDDKYSRNLEFLLYENGKNWTIPENVNVIVHFIKPDGNSGSYDVLPNGEAAFEFTENRLTVALAPQVSTVSGLVQLSVGLYQGQAALSTFGVPIHVQKTAGTPVHSESYYSIMGMLSASGWEPNKYLGTDEYGNVIAKSGPSSSSGNTGGTDGSDTPEATVHGIVWNLVNVSSSNTAVSTHNGASLLAVLTAAEGYTLGDVTVTMGGEALTGVWNADTATVSIASVTGDVVISCAGVEQSTGGIVDTSPVVGIDSQITTHSGAVYENTTSFVTEFFNLPKAEFTAEDSAVLRFYTPYMSGDTGTPKIHMHYNDDYVTEVNQGTPKYPESANKTATLSGVNGTINRFRMSIYKSCKDYCYAYWDATGDVLFAGSESPYYGMANIDGTMAGGGSAPEAASVMSVDDDYAQDYGVSILSLVTDESASVATDAGLDVAFAAVIEEAKNAWMLEANGNVDKIPLIIHTDQHGQFSKPLWDTIDGIVDWYEISKVVNLGDTTRHWTDADTDHPLTKCDALEDYLTSMESVPYSKRIEVFGNHDTWKYENGAYSGLTPQNYLRKYFKNIYARGKDNYGNMVVCDDRYNVKYLIISGMAYDFEIGGYSHYIIPSASWDWIIEQLEQADGYDVVILSHVPLGDASAAIISPVGEEIQYSAGAVDWISRADLWAARKNRTSGSFTDQYGVVHAYDFTGCDGDLLCGLHGHQHEDGYYYVGDSLLDAFFDAYYISPRAFYFVLIDRENRQLNIWKVDDSPKYQNYRIPLDKSAE